MPRSILRSIAATLPASAQRWLRRRRLLYHAGRGTLVSHEPEFGRLAEWIGPGDCVLDIGANVGDYTCRMARLVGPGGRVIAFEPVVSTFAILAEIVDRGGYGTVSLVNAAVSDVISEQGIRVPVDHDGINEYYRAHLSDAGAPGRQVVLTLPVDALALPRRVALVKIDVEGHETAVLRGMQALLARDHPVLIVECPAGANDAWLAQYGYAPRHFAGSPNVLYEPRV